MQARRGYFSVCWIRAVEILSPPFVSSMRLPLASVGQAGAASCAATSQDLAAIGSSHALAEPVDLGAMTLLRLIGTNHSDTPPVSISSGMQASANHNSRIAPAAVVKQRRDPCICKYTKVRKGYYSGKELSMSTQNFHGISGALPFFFAKPKIWWSLCLKTAGSGKNFFVPPFPSARVKNQGGGTVPFPSLSFHI